MNKKKFLICLLMTLGLPGPSMGLEKDLNSPVNENLPKPLTMSQTPEPIDSLVNLTEEEIESLPVTLLCCLLLFGRFAYEN